MATTIIAFRTASPTTHELHYGQWQLSFKNSKLEEGRCVSRPHNIHIRRCRCRISGRRLRDTKDRHHADADADVRPHDNGRVPWSALLTDGRAEHIRVLDVRLRWISVPNRVAGNARPERCMQPR